MLAFCSQEHEKVNAALQSTCVFVETEEDEYL